MLRWLSSVGILLLGLFQQCDVRGCVPRVAQVAGCPSRRYQNCNVYAQIAKLILWPQSHWLRYEITSPKSTKGQSEITI